LSCGTTKLEFVYSLTGDKAMLCKLSYKYSPRNLSIAAPSESLTVISTKRYASEKACGGDRYE
jgi:hypothetical protein